MATYHFKSKNTDFYIISTKQDTDGHAVNTVNGQNSVPRDSVRTHLQVSALAFTAYRSFFLGQFLTVTPAISGNTTVATITGVQKLYVSLQVGLHLCILHESCLTKFGGT